MVQEVILLLLGVHKAINRNRHFYVSPPSLDLATLYGNCPTRLCEFADLSRSPFCRFQKTAASLLFRIALPAQPASRRATWPALLRCPDAADCPCSARSLRLRHTAHL